LQANMQFEEAQKIKEKIEVLENYQSRSTILNPKISNIDVFSIISDETMAYVNFLQISHGAIIRSHTLELKKKLDETNEELVRISCCRTSRTFSFTSKEIILPFALDFGENIKVTVPQLGDKKQILELSERNAKYYRLDQLNKFKLLIQNVIPTELWHKCKKIYVFP
jgi:excinuclease ABC subunit C